MVNGTTRYRGKSGDTLTIGAALGSGGQMLCSNTDATVGLAFTNNGTLALHNSTLTFSSNAVMNGDVVIDLDKLAATDGVLIAMANLTLAESSRLILLGSARTVKLTTYAGTLTGTFSPSSVLPQGYRLVYGPATNGTIAVTSKRGIAFSVR
jgi:hypothetical protein